MLRPPDQHLGLMAQHIYVSDRFTTVGEHHCHIDQYPSTVVTLSERTTHQRCRDGLGQTRSICQYPQANAAGTGHYADPITSYRQASRARSTTQLRSAFQTRGLEQSQVQVALAGQAIPCITTPTIPITRERTGPVKVLRSAASRGMVGFNPCGGHYLHTSFMSNTASVGCGAQRGKLGTCIKAS